MKAALGYLLGIFVLCHITKEQLFQCDNGLDYKSVPCDSGKCCTPEDKVFITPAGSYPTWSCWFFGSYRKFVEGPNKKCVIVSGLCKVKLYYCYPIDTPSSSTTTIATFSSLTRLDNVSNSSVTFENTPTSTSGVKKSTESYCSSSMPETKEVKVSSVGVIVGVSVAVLVLTIVGVVIFLVIRIRRKRTQKRTTTATSKRAITFSNTEYENSNEGIAANRLSTLASNCVSTDITYSAVEKGTRTKVTEQIPNLEFRNYSNYRNVQCADSNEENAYDSTDLQTNHAVIDDTYDHTVSIVNNHAVIEDTYDHTVSPVKSHAVIEDT